MKIYLRFFWVLMFLYLASFQSIAAEGDISLGFYGDIVGGSGEPSNDVLGIGLIGRYQLKDSWFVDLELIQSASDLISEYLLSVVFYLTVKLDSYLNSMNSVNIEAYYFFIR